MVEIFSLLGVFTCVGLVVYYRYTDAKNVTIKTLQDFIKQSEKHIETIVRKKEKEFEDKMIASEIVIERMYHLSSSLQEKLDLFDRDVLQGQELYDALRQELSIVSQDLHEYKQVRSEFKDLEDKFDAIIGIKQQAESSTQELRLLKDQILTFSREFDNMTDDIKVQSRNELNMFFQTMQNDLSDYLSKSKSQLQEKDSEIGAQIQALTNASHAITDKISEFSIYAQTSIDQLKTECERDLEITKSASEANYTDIYDMWDKIKEKAQLETEGILSSLNEHKEFFEQAEEHINTNISQFDNHITQLAEELQTNMHIHLQEKSQELDQKTAMIYEDLENKGAQIQEQLENALTIQTSSVKEELDRVYSAFVEQEQVIEEKIKTLGVKVQDDINSMEDKYAESIETLNSTVLETTNQIHHHLQETLSTQSTETKEELERLNTEFVEQEKSLKNSINTLNEQVENNINIVENKYHESLMIIDNTILEAKTYVQEQLENSLSSQTTSIKEELDRVSSTFVKQEQQLEEKIKYLDTKVQDNISLVEKKYKDGLETIDNTVLEAKQYIQEQLENSLSTQTSSIKDELDKVTATFVGQEQQLEEKIKYLDTKVQDNIDLVENKYKDSIHTIDNTVHEAKQYVQEQLESSLITQTSSIKEKLDRFADEFAEQKNDVQTQIDLLSQQVQENIQIVETKYSDSMGLIDNTINEAKSYIQDQLDVTVSEQTSSLKEELEKITFAFMQQEQELREKISSLDHSILENVTLIEDKYKDSIEVIDNAVANAKQHVQEQLQLSLTSQTDFIKEELDRVGLTFLEQEQQLKDKIVQLDLVIQENMAVVENKYQHNIDTLNTTVQETRDYVDNVFHNAQQQVIEQITQLETQFSENAHNSLQSIENTYKLTVQKKIEQSIDNISEALEVEFKQKYQQNLTDIMQQSESLEDSVKSKFVLIEELEQRFKDTHDIFRQEKENIIALAQKLESDKESNKEYLIDQMESYLNNVHEQLNTSITKFMNTTSQQFTDERESWKERYESIVQEARDEFHRIRSDVDSIQRLIGDIEDASLSNIKRDVDRLTQDAQFKIDDLKNLVHDVLRNTKDDFNNQSESAREEFKTLRQDLKSQEREIQHNIQREVDKANSKIQELDKQFDNFIKKSEKLEQAEELVRKMGQHNLEINELQKNVDQTKRSLQESQVKSEEMIRTLQELHQNSAEADRMNDLLLSTMQEANNLTHIFEKLAEDRSKAEELENLLLRNLETFNDLQDSLNDLESKRIIVEEMMQAITNSTEDISQVSNQSNEMYVKIQDLHNYVQDVQGQLGSLQLEMKEIMGDQKQVRTAVTKLHDLDHVVTHIDEEMKRLEKMSNWIAKSLNQVDQISSKANIGSFEDASNDLEDSNVKNVLRLYEAGWSASDIAKNLKISSPYVELIIERYRS